jgi:hypothetical protein
MVLPFPELKYLNPKSQNSNRKQIPNFKIDEFVKSQKVNLLSFRRKPESSDFSMFWMPDQVRHDEI